MTTINSKNNSNYLYSSRALSQSVASLIPSDDKLIFISDNGHETVKAYGLSNDVSPDVFVTYQGSEKNQNRATYPAYIRFENVIFESKEQSLRGAELIEIFSSGKIRSREFVEDAFVGYEETIRHIGPRHVQFLAKDANGHGRTQIEELGKED